MLVYILFSEKSSRYYVGQTIDIKERLKRHNSGRVNSTKYGMPWKIVLQMEVSNRSEAMLLESKIKKRGAKRYINDHRGVA
ncbi:putative endonuclease [Gillisia sp. Hel_I_86]|uniref:GIY-YIG nuclease family protein n=1 Tax=Gillisia sp. Hel_I_86 TaxID=1249981 RepID=UPI001199415C|nr:GIY-YIG nuclease family protein [Gillisia sp. Hel_I_86]TVZ27915.1 putative endonuclease [Gillisia sp. Hel_I_86]